MSLGEYIQHFQTFPVSSEAVRENVVHLPGAEIKALDYFEEKVSTSLYYISLQFFPCYVPNVTHYLSELIS
jgi:hypothetical protein